MTTDLPEETIVENLNPKTVPEQLVALGTVSNVSDIHIRLQITGGIVCLVDKFKISHAYSKAWERYEKDFKLGKQPLVEPPRLSDLFEKGERYICKIIDKEKRKGYAEAQDIIATLDPQDIQEDNIPSTLLSIPNVPLQGAIVSVEDHGYKVDLGFKNIFGFLKFEECEEVCTEKRGGRKFHVGQIIRCCSSQVLEAGSESRVVQLSMQRNSIKAAKFSKEKCRHHALTQKAILPGSAGYLTVMKVQRGGLIVNFLDEFSGFVGINHLKKDWPNPQKDYKISDVLKCTVLYYNPSTKTFALSLKPQKVVRKTIEHIKENYHIGMIVKEAEVVRLHGTRSVSFKVEKVRAISRVKDAIDEDIATMTKDELHLALDAAFPDGSKHKARIKSINYADMMLVLSLRQDFLESTCVSVDELEPADFLEVQVKKHVKIGIVVTFGLNLRAIILNPHLKDYISPKSYKLYPIGMTLKCRVLKIDPDKYPTRVYATNLEEIMDPEMTIIDAYDKSFRGEKINAIISKLKTNGLIVELFNNVKGFIPLRFCSATKVRALTDSFQVGQVVSCTVYRVDPDRQTMSLCIISYDKVVEMIKLKKKAKQEAAKLKQLRRLDRKIDQNQSLPTSNPKKRKLPDEADPQNQKKIRRTVIQEAESEASSPSEDSSTEGETSDEEENQQQDDVVKIQKSRLQRSIEAKMREEHIRTVERQLLDPNRPAQSIADFERLVLKDPNSADIWIKYSKFFLDSVETEKARLVCRRALSTINFRLEKEKMKVWLHMIMIEAKYGGSERLRELIEEAANTNDKIELYRRASKVLISVDEFDEAQKIFDQLIHKLGGKKMPDIWIDYATFLMDNRQNPNEARSLFDSALKYFQQQDKHQDTILLRSRFAHLEFKHGDVERGKTLFESLLGEHPKRMDLWAVYEAAIKKFGTRQLDTEEVRQQNEQILQRIASLQN